MDSPAVIATSSLAPGSRLIVSVLYAMTTAYAINRHRLSNGVMANVAVLASSTPPTHQPLRPRRDISCATTRPNQGPCGSGSEGQCLAPIGRWKLLDRRCPLRKTQTMKTARSGKTDEESLRGKMQLQTIMWRLWNFSSSSLCCKVELPFHLLSLPTR